MQSSESEKDAKKKLKALKIMADVFVFIILEFIEPTFTFLSAYGIDIFAYAVA